MKERDKFYLKLSLPALIITFLFFLLPLFSVLGRAFNDGPEAVINTFCDAYTWRLLAFTVWESLLSAVISVSLAIPFSVFFSKYSFFGRKAILTASDVAFALPAILCVLGFVIFYGNNGILMRQVAHVLLTRPPLRIKTNPYSPFDLHVLSVPPAFVLSQDQTLYKSCISISVSTELRSLFNNACVITAHFYTLCLSFPFFKGISRVVTYLHCSIFKMLFCVSLSCGTLLLYHI